MSSFAGVRSGGGVRVAALVALVFAGCQDAKKPAAAPPVPPSPAVAPAPTPGPAPVAVPVAGEPAPVAANPACEPVAVAALQREMTEQMIGHARSVFAVLGGHDGDCAAIMTALGPLAAADVPARAWRKAQAARVTALRGCFSITDDEALSARVREELGPLGVATGPVMRACATHPGFRDALRAARALSDDAPSNAPAPVPAQPPATP